MLHWFLTINRHYPLITNNFSINGYSVTNILSTFLLTLFHFLSIWILTWYLRAFFFFFFWSCAYQGVTQRSIKDTNVLALMVESIYPMMCYSMRVSFHTLKCFPQNISSTLTPTPQTFFTSLIIHQLFAWFHPPYTPFGPAITLILINSFQSKLYIKLWNPWIHTRYTCV